ncbi:MAG: phosphoheptose isomerase [Betaproteobacteria bacterium SG8_39]|nr:MAG: phosphoheptose isomerase [Betaproteobacteria bacterium SG8_39]
MAVRVGAHFRESANLKLSSAQLLAAPIARAASLMADALRAGGKILACGNGGSAADAQHFAAELVNRFEIDRPPLAAVALTTDSSALTSIANDFRYEDVFAKQLRAIGRAGDVLLAISTSGNSASILEAVAVAQAIGARVVALTGGRGGKLGERIADGDVHVNVPHTSTARVQEVHLLALHCLCDAIDYQMFGVKS